MSELREFAFHMQHKKTGKERIKKIRAVDVDHAHCSDVGYDKEWRWIGTEPWHNVANDVIHIGRGYYIKKEN